MPDAPSTTHARSTRNRLVAVGVAAAAVGAATGGLGIGARELLHRQADHARRLIG